MIRIMVYWGLFWGLLFMEIPKRYESSMASTPTFIVRGLPSIAVRQVSHDHAQRVGNAVHAWIKNGLLLKKH